MSSRSTPTQCFGAITGRQETQDARTLPGCCRRVTAISSDGTWTDRQQQSMGGGRLSGDRLLLDARDRRRTAVAQHVALQRTVGAERGHIVDARLIAVEHDVVTPL